MDVRRYSAQDRPVWDAFVRSAKNGLFMFERAYMDYHSDRFADHSLLVYEQNRLTALLPANAEGTQIISHGGLTFGGFVVSPKLKIQKMLDCMRAAVAYLRDQGFSSLVYKQVPHIYCEIPSEEDVYALFRAGAVLVKVEPSTAICLCRPAAPKPCSNKAERLGVTVAQSRDYAGYWALLAETLASRHGCRPTHSLDEMLALRGAFPENIELYTACLDGELLVGALLYLYPEVAHTQYLAASPRGREVGALDLLLAELVRCYAAEKRYFDFGISTENNGLFLNEGLIWQKERHGGRTVVHNTWRLQLS